MATPHELSLPLEIVRLDEGAYEAELGGGIFNRGGKLTVYSSIADAIRGEAADLPDDLCYFVEVRYGGLSSGSIPTGELSQRAEEIGSHLVALIAEYKLIEAR